MSDRSNLASTPAIPVSWGELFDKITILEIKCERFTDRQALENVRRELGALAEVVAASAISSATVAEQIAALRAVNRGLWNTENAIRACEGRGDFGETFIRLARSVYRENDKRARIKKEINSLLGSALVEEKSYI